MNWSKGKNMLIILFLSINITLGWANYRKESDSYILKETQVQDIKQVMLENDIMIDSTVPRGYQPLQRLTVLPYQMDSSSRESFVKKVFGTLDDITISVEAPKTPNEKPKRLYTKENEVVIFEGERVSYRHSEVKEAVEPLNVNGAKKTGEKWLKKIGYPPRKMHLQIVEKSDCWQMIYYDQYEKIPVFNSYVKLTITPLGVEEAEIQKVDLGEVAGAEEAIFSVDQVFFSLMKEIKKQEAAVITDIMLGYALENPKGTQLIAEKAIPFYQVILEDGRIYYVNAYNNEIMEEASE